MVLWFIVDLALNFNTGYWDRGILIMKRNVIINHYLTSWFVFDLIASFPYEWIALPLEKSVIY
jgi:hypothetical protein